MVSPEESAAGDAALKALNYTPPAQGGGSDWHNDIKLYQEPGGGTKDTGQPTPQQEEQNMQKTGDIVNSIFPGKQVGDAIGTLGGYALTALQEKLGLVPKGTTDAYNLNAPSPLQVGGDIAKGAALIGGLKMPLPGATTVVGKMGQAALQGGEIGAVAGGGEAATKTSGETIPTGSDIGQVAKGTAIGGGTGAIVGGAISGLSSLFEKAGEKISTSVIKPSQADIKDGFSVDTIKKYDLGGSLGTTLDKTEARMNDLTKQLNQKLADSTANINLGDVYKATEEKLKGNKLSSFGANTSMQNGLQQLQNEISAVAGESGTITIPDAQIVKRAAGHFGAWQFGMTDPESTARETVYNTFYNQMKTAIEKNSPEGVQGINKQLQELIPVANAVVRRIPVASRNNALSLGDLITLTAGAINPHALGSFALSLASKSGTAGNLLMNLAPKLQELAPKIGGFTGLGATAITEQQSQANQ